MKDLYLNPSQVKAFIKKAEREHEVIVVRCVRKTAASKPGGTDKDQVYDLHCATKPPAYRSARSVGLSARDKEDKKNAVLTVFATNRQDSNTKTWGAWRRVNLQQVIKLIYRTKEYEVKIT
jgi:hypothetical protein